MLAQSIAALASVAVAIAALIFSINSFYLQQERADQQQLRAEKTAAGSVIPLLWIQGQNYTNMKAVQLRNHGLGPAIIKAARFEKDGYSTDNIIELFARPSVAKDLRIGTVAWETYVDLPAKRVIPAQADISLVKQSLENLRGQGLDENDGLELLRRIQQVKKGIKVHIEYLNAFGHEMEPLDIEI